jgi:acetoin utilization deacetylase AcuC-like enzyme
MPHRLLLVTHPDCLRHDPGAAHPEGAARLAAIEAALAAETSLGPERVRREVARPAAVADLLRVHGSAHVEAMRALADGLARRVLVVDWDVHHGDGTQAVFWEDAAVHVLSLHLHPHYPHTGGADERGAGPGLGATRNVPLEPGTGGAGYLARFSEALDASLREARPDLVLVSAGFDLLAGDPQGGLALEPRDLHAVTAALLARADAAGAPVAAVLEGGYVPERLGAAVVNVARALARLAPA